MHGAAEQVRQLYLEAREDVYRYLLNLGIRPAPAQELTQDTFLRLYEAMSKGQEIREPRAWVFRVAHNLGLTARARERFSQPLDESLGAALRDRAVPVERTLIERERLVRIQNAVAQLSPQQKQVLELRVDGLRYREIAETLGLGLSTVYEFLNRAVGRLRKAAE